MGKKDRKSEPQSTAQAASSDIVTTSFGDTIDQSSFSFLFSDANPFKRKHQEVGQGFGAPVGTLDRNADGGSAKVEVKRRKVVEEALDTPSEKTKSKKEKRKVLDLAVSASKKESKKLKEKGEPESSTVEEAVSSELAVRSEKLKKEEGNQEKSNKIEKKDKKKRKREELEAAYESRKYGADKDASKEDEATEPKTAGKKRKKTDSPEEDMMVSKEGFDDESKLLRTVFVGNLPLKIKKKALLKEFSQFGEVESVRIRSVPIADTKVPRKGAILSKKFSDNADSIHAYIVFKTDESAKASLVHNMAVVGGNHIRVDRACPPRKKLKGENTPLYDNKRTVFVGNLPFDVKDEEIYQLFSRINNLESSMEAVRVIRDPNTSVGKGIAYVLFKTREAANQVVKKRYLKLRDRELRLSHAKKDTNSTPSKRNYPSTGGAFGTPSKKLAMESSDTPNRAEKPNKASLSYQGLEGKKASSLKKDKPWKKPKNGGPAITVSTKKVTSKDRSGKRPSVVARKAKANALRDIGGPAGGGVGKKRKLESRTPESSKMKKKVKKFKQNA